MNRFNRRMVCGVLLAAGWLLVGAASAAILNVPGDYATIQAAIDAAYPDDEIVVAVGTYNGHVTIDKSLVLKGAQFGVDANGRTGSETLIEGSFQIQAPATDVTIDGFSFIANSGANELSIGGPYHVCVGGGASTVSIANNIFNPAANTNGPFSPGLVHLTGTALTVQDNVITQHLLASDPLALLITANGTALIDNNTVTAAIGVGTGAGASVAVTDNTVTDAWNDGIWFWPVNASAALTITGNTVTDYDASGGGAKALKVVSKPATINGEAQSIAMLAELEADNPNIDSFLLQWMGPVHNVTQDLFYTTIQAAVDGAAAGDEIGIGAGVYPEQVWITTDDLVLVGAGAGGDPAADTIIQAPATQMANSFDTGVINRPVVGIIGCTGVALQSMRVDGAGMGNVNYRFQGVGFWNAGGAITGCEIWNIQDTPFSGSQHGVGVYAYNDTGGPYTIAMTDVWVEDYQKNALALSGEGLTVDLENVTTVGAGPTDVTAQNGIQIGFGAGGAISDCDVSGNIYTGENWSSAGILAYMAAPVAIDGTVVLDNYVGVDFNDSDGSFLNGTIQNTDPTSWDAIYVRNSVASKKEAGDDRLAPASPYLEDAVRAGGGKSLQTCVLTDSQFIGHGKDDSWGVYVRDSVGTTTVDMSGCEVTGWWLGVYAKEETGAAVVMTANDNVIAGNSTYGFYSLTALAPDASCNWWGDIGGPDAAGNPNPAGDVVDGDVVFWPWLDAADGECNQYGGDNVSVADGSACLTPANVCVTLPVVFNRTDTTPSRGVSVTFELSAELELCGTPAASILQSLGAGSWSDGYSQPNFQIIDNGGGSYTVDQAILGGTCGPTTGGELFTVSVAAAVSGVETIGTVTVTEVLVRDCDNQPLPGIPGASGSVTVDEVAPDALDALAAVQQKTGNPAGQTTNILLSWTDPGGDVAEVQIWRKGYGDYPEYDDGTGAAPAAPVTALNGWTSVATVAASDEAYVDYTDDRDFYYYATYVIDACGNVSVAGDLTEGTLNYHLGDVTDGATPGVGDNAVETVDISLLGNNYGITLAHGDPVNYLDVGPTTDYSVDGRPTTDDRVQFEDLMMFAINYGQVSKSDLPVPHPAAFNELVLQPGAMGAVGEVFEVSLHLSSDGRIQGLSVPLTWNAAVVEPVGVRAGELLAAQGGLGMVLSPEPGTVDAALLGVRDQGLSGEGVLAVASFRVKSAGDPRIGLGTLSARDAQNQEIDLHGAVSSDVPGSLPQISTLSAAMPNPFNPSTELSFAIVREGAVKLSVYSLRGQLVSTLVHGRMSAGRYTATWNGTDATGQSVASGSYIVRLEAPDRTQSQRIMLVK